ncbi:MAG: hypothetical protein R3A79_16630 [Nannocystaceae bacterium]
MYRLAPGLAAALAITACRDGGAARAVVDAAPERSPNAAVPEGRGEAQTGAAQTDEATADEGPPPVAKTPPPARIAAAEGAALRPAYSGCLGDFTVGEVAGEAYVLYGYGATGRVDRLAADGSVAEAYDLPIGASVLRYASPKGPASGAKVPIAALRAIGGLGPRELFVVAELNVANETWDDSLFELRGRRWKEASGSGSALYPRGDAGVLGYEGSEEERDVSYFSAVAGPVRAPELEVILEHAHAAGAGPDTLDDIFGPPGIDVYDYAVSRRGPILALVRYHDRLGGSEATPVGSWLMVWGADGALAGIERVRETFELEDEQVAAGDDAGYVLSEGALRRWRAGAFESLPTPEFVGASEACLYLGGVDPERRLWVGCDREIARLEGDTWIRETLPVDAATIAGVEEGALWLRAEDDALWSRAADGTWTRHAVPVVGPVADASGPHTRLRVTSDGAAWLVREFVHSAEVTGAGQLVSTTFVDTSRPLASANACRGVDPRRPSEPTRRLD